MSFFFLFFYWLETNRADRPGAGLRFPRPRARFGRLENTLASCRDRFYLAGSSVCGTWVSPGYKRVCACACVCMYECVGVCWVGAGTEAASPTVKSTPSETPGLPAATFILFKEYKTSRRNKNKKQALPLARLTEPHAAPVGRLPGQKHQGLFLWRTARLKQSSTLH